MAPQKLLNMLGKIKWIFIGSIIKSTVLQKYNVKIKIKISRYRKIKVKLKIIEILGVYFNGNKFIFSLNIQITFLNLTKEW